MRRRVVVTGAGVFSAIGNDRAGLERSLRAGEDGFRPIRAFPTEAYPHDRAAVLAGPPPGCTELEREHPEWEAADRYGVACARRALADAGLDPAALDPLRTAVVVASSNAGVETSHRHAARRLAGEGRPGDTVLRTPATAAATIRRSLGLCGPQLAVSTACAAGSNALGLARDLIVDGFAELAIAGGVEPFSELSFSGFTLLKSLSPGPSRPFDEHRDGTGLGEAACLLVLEDAERAERRGARALGEILGYGLSDDAHHATAPDPQGRGARSAIEQCLQDAGLRPQEVDYVNAHGTGTRYNDPMELRALREVFGWRLAEIPVSSTKPLHGHTLSCAGSLEALVCLLAIAGGFVPGNAGIVEPMHGAEGLCIPARSVPGPGLRTAISTSFGFGGNNTCIALRGTAAA